MAELEINKSVNTKKDSQKIYLDWMIKMNFLKQ